MIPENGSEEADERRDDGDRPDDAQVTLQRVEVLHQRYGERICDVRAIFRSTHQAELEDPGQHALLVSHTLIAPGMSSVAIFWPSDFNNALLSPCCLAKRKQSLDDDRDRNDR